MKLIFVYNAETGLINQSIDFLHKMIKPETYECNLCRITHGNFVMNKKWQAFINGLQIETEFKYKNQLNEEQLQKTENNFPSVLIETNDQLKMLIDTAEMNKIKNEDELITFMNDKLKSIEVN